jgi:hypothetical protein
VSGCGIEGYGFCTECAAIVAYCIAIGKFSEFQKELFLPCTQGCVCFGVLFFEKQHSHIQNPAHKISSRLDGVFLSKVGENYTKKKQKNPSQSQSQSQ